MESLEETRLEVSKCFNKHSTMARSSNILLSRSQTSSTYSEALLVAYFSFPTSRELSWSKTY